MDDSTLGPDPPAQLQPADVREKSGLISGPLSKIFAQAQIKSPYFWLVLLAGIALTALNVFTVVFLWSVGMSIREFGWEARPQDGVFVIRAVDGRGPAAGKLQVGDRLLAIDDDPRVSRADPSIKLDHLPAGQSKYDLRVQRSGHDLNFHLETATRQALLENGSPNVEFSPRQAWDQQLIGMFLMGPKKSEEPYDFSDRAVLQAIAAQVAISYENFWLRESVMRGEQIRRGMLVNFDSHNIQLVKQCPDCGACYDGAEEHCGRDGQELRLELAVERLINGRYRLDQFLGKGAMGAVYCARDIQLDRTVAIKLMVSGALDKQSAMRRFQREARAVARLRHANIVIVYDFGVLAGSGAFLVMEFLGGITWRKDLQSRRAFPPHILAKRVDELLTGLEAAHRENVVHRDLKPENIMINQDIEGREVIKILDFGLAKILETEFTDQYSASTMGAVVGTPGYMAPEQFGGCADQRSDIFATGVIVAESLTGGRPFRGETQGELLQSMTAGYQLPIGFTEAEQLKGILEKCLAMEPSRRFSTISEFHKDLIGAILKCSRICISGAAETHCGPRGLM